ncbi:transformer-2 protein homolog alpha-like isoform X1 [Mizuhopecten yessoensis]|uniref:transformer-2 protein homolog alpha-like isoform X1 n=1 Tax=Mizuhopecten yessoensis TaxID=6573 RepID=UPI000B45A881|nr:transformer-2 protein homolog alpha-like isoform X1 [Mizuhopecten yessoensis]
MSENGEYVFQRSRSASRESRDTGEHSGTTVGEEDNNSAPSRSLSAHSSRLSRSRSKSGSPYNYNNQRRAGYSRSRSRSRSRSPRHRRRRSYSRSHSRSRSRSPYGDRRRRSGAGRSRRDHDRGRRTSYRSRSRSPPRRGYRGKRDTSPMSNRRRHQGNRDNPEPTRCLGIFGLSLYTQERDLRDVFSRYGSLEEVQVVYDRQSGRSRGFAFIYFRNIEDSIEAKDRCTGSEIDGRRIRVDYSITERAHTPTPGIYLGKPTASGYSGGERGSGERGSGERGGGSERGGGERGRSRRSPSPNHGRRGRYNSRSRSRSFSPRGHY